MLLALISRTTLMITAGPFIIYSLYPSACFHHMFQRHDTPSPRRLEHRDSLIRYWRYERVSLCAVLWLVMCITFASTYCEFGLGYALHVKMVLGLGFTFFFSDPFRVRPAKYQYLVLLQIPHGRLSPNACSLHVYTLTVS